MSIFGGTVNNSEISRASYFTEYTPQIVGTAGTPTLSIAKGQYIYLGKLVYVRLYAIVSATGGATAFSFTLPFKVDNAAAVVDLAGTSPSYTNLLMGWCPGSNKLISGTISDNLITVRDFVGNPVADTGLYTLQGWFAKK